MVEGYYIVVCLQVERIFDSGLAGLAVEVVMVGLVLIELVLALGQGLVDCLNYFP